MTTATATKTRKTQRGRTANPVTPPADVPEHDEDHPVTSANPTPAPATTPEAPAPRTGNSAQASEEQRNTLAAIMNEFRKKGWTRPAMSAITGFNDSQVWRAFNRKVHTAELDTWLTFIDEVNKGVHRPPTSGRKPKIEEVQARLAAVEAAHQARVERVLAKLGDEARTVAQYRKLVAEAAELLTGDDASA